MTALPREANGSWVRSTEIKDAFERSAAHVRLVSQDNGPVGKVVIPSVPVGGALNRTEHSPTGIRVPNAVNRRKPKPVKLGLEEPSTRGPYDNDLSSTQRFP